MPVTVCDPDAFFPLRELVAGPFTDLKDLDRIERFVRAVVLHDEIFMELEPVSYEPETEEEFTQEEIRAGGRAVIVGIGPSLAGYEFFSETVGPGKRAPDVELSPALIETAREFSNADEGNVYYKAHIDYLRRVVDLVHRGGSAVLDGAFGSAAIDATATYPAKLFEGLDESWQNFAHVADEGLGFTVPPVLSIILTRCARREAIPHVVNDLRAEWADARNKIWVLIEQLKEAETISDAEQIRQELTLASRMLSPKADEIDTRPVRVLWEIIAGGAGGTATALMSGGRPAVGAVAGAITAASRSVPSLVSEFGRALFGRGAFDLARRIRMELRTVEYEALARLLSDSEKRNLRL